MATAGVTIAAGMPMAMNSCAGANDKIVCGVIGVNGQGFANLKAFLAQKNTECAAICDVDSHVLEKRIADVEKIQGTRPKGFADFRNRFQKNAGRTGYRYDHYRNT